MVITLQLDSETPLYEQICNQIILGIATGRLAKDEKLPTVRQLASDLGINQMTVNKAYALLKQEGYIVIDRRHGAKINSHVQETPTPQQSARLEERLQLLIAQASIQGISPSGFAALCARIFSTMQVQPHPSRK